MIKRQQGYKSLSFFHSKADNAFESTIIYKWGDNKKKIKVDSATLKLPVLSSILELSGMVIKWDTTSEVCCNANTQVTKNYERTDIAVKDGYINFDISDILAFALKNDKNLVMKISAPYEIICKTPSKFARDTVSVFYESRFYAPKKSALKVFDFDRGRLIVDVQSGNKEVEFCAVSGEGKFPINVKLVCNSLARQKDGFLVLGGNGANETSCEFYCGRGWKINYQQYLYVETITETIYVNVVPHTQTIKRYTWIREDGSQISFDERFSANVCGKEENFFYKLEVDDDNNVKGVLLNNFEQKKVDVTRSLEPVDGYSLTAPIFGVTKEGATENEGDLPLLRITDSCGNAYGFSPTENDGVFKLTVITDCGGNSQKLIYDEFDRLAQIIGLDGESVAVKYDLQGKIISINGTCGGVKLNYSGSELTAIYDYEDRLNKATFHYKANKLKAFVSFDGIGYYFEHNLEKCKKVQKICSQDPLRVSNCSMFMTGFSLYFGDEFECTHFNYLSDSVTEVADVISGDRTNYFFDTFGRVVQMGVAKEIRYINMPKVAKPY